MSSGSIGCMNRGKSRTHFRDARQLTYRVGNGSGKREIIEWKNSCETASFCLSSAPSFGENATMFPPFSYVSVTELSWNTPAALHPESLHTRLLRGLLHLRKVDVRHPDVDLFDLEAGHLPDTVCDVVPDG